MSQLVRERLLDHLPAMKAVAWSLTYDSEDTKDAVQEACMRALAQEHTYCADVNLRGWLLTITRNACYLMLNRRSHPATPRAMELALLENIVAAPDDTEMVLHIRDMRRGLSKLSLNHRRAIELISRPGATYEAAAETEKTTYVNMRSRVSRARKQLREFVEHA